MRQRRGEAWAKWRGLVEEQGRSGQSVAAFCRERGLRDGQFFAWRKRLRETEAARPNGDDVSLGRRAARFVAVEVAPEAVEGTRLAPVVHGGAIEVRLRGSRSLVVEPGFDAQHLRALLSVLEAEA
jgi:transposase-like protein